MKFCPNCNSKNIDFVPPAYVNGGLASYYECYDCSWNEWKGAPKKDNKTMVDFDMLAQALHREVMNIRCNVPIEFQNPSPEDRAYKIGHRDARHSAAEAILRRLKEILEGEE